MGNPVENLQTISSFRFPFCCDEFNIDKTNSNRKTLLRHNPSKQELRVTSQGAFYNLNKGSLVSQIFYSVINLFIKWYYEGWNADSSIQPRLAEAVDRTFIHSIKIVSKQVTDFIKMAKLFDPDLRLEAQPAENAANTQRNIELRVTSTVENLFLIVLDLIEIQRKLKNKPTELKLYNTPFPINEAIRVKNRMLQGVNPLRGDWQISEEDQHLLNDFLFHYRKQYLVDTIVGTKRALRGIPPLEN